MTRSRLVSAGLLASLLLAAAAVADAVSLTRLDAALHQASIRRNLQQTENTTSGTGTLDPVTPMAQMPGEVLPSGLDAIQLPAGSVTVSLTLTGTTANEFRSNYQATVATIIGTVSGTPAGRWQFKVGDFIDLSSTSSNSSTSQAASPVSVDVQPNITVNVNMGSPPTGQSSGSNTTSSESSSSSGSSSSNNDSSSSSSSNSTSSSSGNRKLLQQAQDSLKVSLTIIASKPQLVVYRLSKASTAEATAAAAAVANSCTTEYCSRIVAAGLPVDSKAVQVSPDLSTFITNPNGITLRTKADLDAEERSKFLGAVIGGTLGGVLGLVLLVLLARWLWYRHNTKQTSLPVPLDPKDISYMPDGSSSKSLSSKQLELQAWGKFESSSSLQNKGLTLDISRAGTQETGIPDTPNSVQLAAIAAAAAAAAQRASNSAAHPTPFSTANDQSPAVLGTANSGGNFPYPPQNIPNNWAASGMGIPLYSPTMLSTYGTPGVYGTPELVPDPQFTMVRPEQLNQALQQYWASVQTLQGMFSTQGTPRMTPQATPGYLTPTGSKRSPLPSPKRSPLSSPRRSPRGSPRVLSPVRTRSGGYDVLQ